MGDGPPGRAVPSAPPRARPRTGPLLRGVARGGVHRPGGARTDERRQRKFERRPSQPRACGAAPGASPCARPVTGLPCGGMGHTAGLAGRGARERRQALAADSCVAPWGRCGVARDLRSQQQPLPSGALADLVWRLMAEGVVQGGRGRAGAARPQASGDTARPPSPAASRRASQRYVWLGPHHSISHRTPELGSPTSPAPYHVLRPAVRCGARRSTSRRG